ncbi:MAG: hypothetical protein JSV86_03000 [Gemmatimonadota bacterium]|nr:MAG: hypothetical protein JSV86_03000 [Gemmatimonadota bacterium]
MHRLISRLAVILLLAGCTDAVGPPQLTIWEATLIGTPGYPEFTGSAAAISRTTGSEISILIEGLPSGTSYAWRIRRGDCQDPGSIFSSEDAYPDLDVDESGSATTNIFIGRTLAASSTYHVAVLTLDLVPELVACGNLIPRQ